MDHFLVQDSTHWNNSQDLKGQLGTVGGGIHMLVEYSLILTGLLTEGIKKKEGASKGGWNILSGEKHEKKREKH